MSTADGSIRPATSDDLGSVRECLEQAYRVYEARLDHPPAPVFADYAGLVEAGHVFVLEEGDDIPGLIVMFPDERGLFVENVAVRPAHQGKGLGRRLMAFAEERAQELGCDRVHLYTNVLMHENIALYTRLGYVETDRRVDEGYERVFMETLAGRGGREHA